MHRSITLFGLGALALQVRAQGANFVNMTWGAVKVGQMWPINWSVGNGQPITLAFGNATWSEIIASSISATPGTYDWTIAVPAGFVPGQYVLALSQNGAGTTDSPIFGVTFGSVIPPPSSVTSGTSSMSMPTASMSSNATMTMSPAMPTVTVIWWDPDCTCHRTSTSVAPAAATGAGSSTMSTWYDDTCGCNKTALAPAATMAPAGNNYTAPMATPVAPAASNPPAASPAAPAVSQYKGAAAVVRIAGPSLGMIVLAAAVLL